MKTMLFHRFYKVFLSPRFQFPNGNLLLSKLCFFDRFYKVFLPPRFYNFTRNHGFGNHAFLTGFIRGFGGCDVAFVKKSVSSFVFFETILFLNVL